MELVPTEKAESKKQTQSPNICSSMQMLCQVLGTQRGFLAFVELMVLLGRQATVREVQDRT